MDSLHAHRAEGGNMKITKNDADAVKSVLDPIRKTKAVLEEVFLERYKQDQKWGEQNHNPADWLMILGEEFGEASKAALEAKFVHNDGGRRYRKELVQVAAVAVAMIECLDRGNFWE
jgi:hypothetical protein